MEGNVMTQRVSLIGGSISFAMVIFLNILGTCPAQGSAEAPALEEVVRYEQDVGRYEQDVTTAATKREKAPPATMINDSKTCQPSSRGGLPRGL
jgi:hypothetical protein